MSTLKKSLRTLGAITAIGGLIAATPVPGGVAYAGCGPYAPKAKKASGKKASANPCAAAKKNPCAAAKKNPCGAKNPCAPKR